MQCPRCQQENRQGRRFCSECGTLSAGNRPSAFPAWPPSGMSPHAERGGWPRRSTSSERARLFRTLATLRADVPLGVEVDALRWTGPRADFKA
jgi:hypothetical protein